MVFEDAGPAEIVRLSQKDAHYVVNLRSQVAILLQKTKGIQWWILWHKEIQLMTDALYYALTTLQGNQTLGEEYVNVIQVDVRKTRIPNTLKRVILILFHVGGAYAINRLAQFIRQTLVRHPRLMAQHPKLRRFIEDALPRLSQVITILHRCHLLLFYFQVRYYDFAKRLTGIRYVLIRPWLEDGLSRWGYYVLGFLSFLQLLLSAAIYVFSYWSRSQSKFTFDSNSLISSKENKSASGSCPLCLSSPVSPTATPCGHVFCWTCIFQWLDMKPQCPLCGDKFDPSRLIYLRN